MTIKLPGSNLSSSPGTTIKASAAAAQAPVAATRTLITGTAVQIPDSGLQVGSRLKFKFQMTKTGAGSATSTIDIAIVAPGSTVVVGNATAALSFTKPAGTAVADDAIVEVEALVTAISATAGGLQGSLKLEHNLASTGHAAVPVAVVPAVSTTANTAAMGGGSVVLAITSGAADAITINYATGEVSV